MNQPDTPSDGAAATAVQNPTSSSSLERYYEEQLENVRQHLPAATHELKEAGV